MPALTNRLDPQIQPSRKDKQMATTIKELLERKQSELIKERDLHNQYVEELNELRGQDAPDEAKVTELRDKRAASYAKVEALRAEVDGIEKDKREEDRVAELQGLSTPTDVRTNAHDNTVKVGGEPRTYSKDKDRTGKDFALDVVRATMGDPQSAARINRHMEEERVERGIVVERAAGTGAFAGLVVPQYLTDLYAPAAKAGRPTVDAMRKHELPSTGMTVYIGKVTTPTSVDIQASENATVAEQDIDDTLLSLPVRTAAGSQTVSRQAYDRGVGVEDTIIDDLTRSMYVAQDTTVLNVATDGLRNVATNISLTDTTPTAAELYPKLVQATVAVEEALLDQQSGDTIAVFNPRRWGWLQTQLTSTWPMFGQPGVAPQLGGENFDVRYGRGFRGQLPNGAVAIADGNVGKLYGTATNEDEIYFFSQNEAHFWEDPAAPMLIRADISAKSLGVDLVVYSYFAFTFQRRAHAQKLSGVTLVPPTWA
jgi:hypothetical protein